MFIDSGRQTPKCVPPPILNGGGGGGNNNNNNNKLWIVQIYNSCHFQFLGMKHYMPQNTELRYTIT